MSGTWPITSPVAGFSTAIFVRPWSLLVAGSVAVLAIPVSLLVSVRTRRVDGFGWDRDVAFDDLARWAFGQLVDEPDPARVFVGGDAGLDELLDRRGVRVGTGLQRDCRTHLFAEHVVGDADYGRLADG